MLPCREPRDVSKQRPPPLFKAAKPQLFQGCPEALEVAEAHRHHQPTHPPKDKTGKPYQTTKEQKRDQHNPKHQNNTITTRSHATQSEK
ncbi:MAG: hypothetical protein NWE96_11335 [Candidatus Bathyarchaeota archaeon]|nr:hypothetical protein [Candidatus Bathyarchaeota archaeon]